MIVRCGLCGHDGRIKNYDGVGGAWYDVCYQCQGRKTLDAEVPHYDSLVLKFDQLKYLFEGAEDSPEKRDGLTVLAELRKQVLG